MDITITEPRIIRSKYGTTRGQEIRRHCEISRNDHLVGEANSFDRGRNWSVTIGNTESIYVRGDRRAIRRAVEHVFAEQVTPPWDRAIQN